MGRKKYLFSDDDPAGVRSSKDQTIARAHRIGRRVWETEFDPSEMDSQGREFASALPMSAAVEYDDLASVPVQGTTMDYHGSGVPTSALRGLKARVLARQNAATGEGVLVGLVDTAFFGNPWLEGGYLAAPAEYESAFPQAASGSAPRDVFAGHSTFVAGLILQQAPAAGVWVEKALDSGGKAFANQVAQAAFTLAERKVDILNLSLGCFADEPYFGKVMKDLVEDLHRENPEMVIVASANKKPGEESREFSGCPGRRGRRRIGSG